MSIINRGSSGGSSYTPRDGYEDLKPTGGRSSGKNTSPADTLLFAGGNILLPAYREANTDAASFVFHLPHDYVPESDLFFHVHHTSNALTPSGNTLWRVYWTYARGYDLESFSSTEVVTDIIGSVPSQYSHHITESSAITEVMAGGIFQTDGVILATLERVSGDALDTSTEDAFFLEFDIHYKSDGTKTVEKNESGSGYTKVF